MGSTPILAFSLTGRCLICVIIVTPRGLTVDDDVLRKAWDDNDDGAGYMFAANGNLTVRKPFWKFADFLESYKRDTAKYGDESAFVVHFRWATHGKLTELNTHPHSLCGGRVGMVHNGIFPDTPSDVNISDTVYFCRTVLAKRQPSQLLGRRFREYLEDQIGSNRVVFMDWMGKISIVNAVMGDWIDGVWFSNLNFLARPAWHSSGWKPISANNSAILPPVSQTANEIVASCTGEVEDDESAVEEAWREYAAEREAIEQWSGGEPPRRQLPVELRSDYIAPGPYPKRADCAYPIGG